MFEFQCFVIIVVTLCTCSWTFFRFLSREEECGLPGGPRRAGMGVGDGGAQKRQVHRGDDRDRDPREGAQAGRERDRGNQVRNETKDIS